MSLPCGRRLRSPWPSSPLDGGSSIGPNVLIAFLYAIHPAKDCVGVSAPFPARDLLTGDHVIRGPRCCLAVSCGQGTQTQRR